MGAFLKIKLTPFEFQIIELALLKLQGACIAERNDFETATEIKTLLVKIRAFFKK